MVSFTHKHCATAPVSSYPGSSQTTPSLFIQAFLRMHQGNVGKTLTPKVFWERTTFGFALSRVLLSFLLCVTGLEAFLFGAKPCCQAVALDASVVVVGCFVIGNSNATRTLQYKIRKQLVGSRLFRPSILGWNTPGKNNRWPSGWLASL